MEKILKKLLIISFTMLSFALFPGTVVINTDTSDPAPKKAFKELIEDFERENPDVNVKWNVF